MLQALREALEAVAPAGASGGGRGGGSTGESVREGLVQVGRQPLANCPGGCSCRMSACSSAAGCKLLLFPSPSSLSCALSPTLLAPWPQTIGCVGTRMRSHHAHTLLLGIMITQLDRAPPVRALAAEALLGGWPSKCPWCTHQGRCRRALISRTCRLHRMAMHTAVCACQNLHCCCLPPACRSLRRQPQGHAARHALRLLQAGGLPGGQGGAGCEATARLPARQGRGGRLEQPEDPVLGGHRAFSLLPAAAGAPAARQPRAAGRAGRAVRLRAAHAGAGHCAAGGLSSIPHCSGTGMHCTYLCRGPGCPLAPCNDATVFQFPLPQALPMLVVDGNMQGMEQLAQQARHQLLPCGGLS